MSNGGFELVQRKDKDDEEERFLGAIRLKSGREFIVTAVSDPKGQWFRVYGMRG
jgi:hypothetical protein